MAGTCIVLNGTSSAGKTSIALALRELWPGPLQISGVDTFLLCQSDSFFGSGGVIAPGVTRVPTIVDGVPAAEVVAGPMALKLFRAAQRFWRACADEGLDQVVNDVWIAETQALEFKALMADTNVLWVAVRCPVEVVEQRERRRGDRHPGQGRGIGRIVHSWADYDLEVDTSKLSPQECARAILDALDGRKLPS